MTYADWREKFGVPDNNAMGMYIKNKLSSYYSNGITMNKENLVDFLRKQESIKYLKMGIAPEIILYKGFGLEATWRKKPNRIYVDKTYVRDNFERYFKDEGLSFEEIIQKHARDPLKILEQYKTGNLILYYEPEDI